MITMGQRWMSAIVSWVPGLKHYATPRTVYANCVEYDRVRQILMARCRKCGQTVSRDEKAVKELVFKCGDTSCDCHKGYGTKAHQVCSVCYDMFHSLYANYSMKNRNYFKELDEKDKEDPDKRKRMGL